MRPQLNKLTRSYATILPVMVFNVFTFGFMPPLNFFQPSVTSYTCSPIVLPPAGQKTDLQIAQFAVSMLDSTNLELTKAIQLYRSSTGVVAVRVRPKVFNLAKSRKELLAEAVQISPEKALASVLSTQDNTALASLTRGCAEMPVSLSGKLEMSVADYYEDKTAIAGYSLLVPGNKLRLYPSQAMTMPALSGQTVTIKKGYRLDNMVFFGGTNSLSSDQTPVAKGGIAEDFGDQPTLVVLVNFQNNPQPNLDKNQMNDIVFNGVRNYYLENSYNQTVITGGINDILGWNQIPINKSCYLWKANPADTTPNVLDEALKIVESNNINLTSYKRLLIFADFDCGWGGISTVGPWDIATSKGDARVSVEMIKTGSNNPKWLKMITVHELGHGFGILHASLLNCGDVPVRLYSQAGGNRPDGCNWTEYGDPYDPMGYPYPAGHMDAPHKEYIGWLSPQNILTVKSSGTYNIESLEWSSNGVKALKIPRGPNLPTDYLYIEYRQPLGIDQDMQSVYGDNVYNGGLLHVLNPRSTTQTYLLDASPPADAKTAVLPVGSTFTDPETETQIAVVSRNQDFLTVQVTMKGDTAAPTVSLISPQNSSTVSGVVSIEAAASDNVGVNRVEFYLDDQTAPFTALTSAPYRVSGDSRLVGNGYHTLIAKAYDGAGNVGTASVGVTVSNIVPDTTPPNVAIISPQGGSAVSGMVTIEALSSDNVGVVKVEFYLDQSVTPIATLTTAPYKMSGDSNAVANGFHTLYAKAYDGALNVGQSAVVTVIVNNVTSGLSPGGDTILPNLTIIAPSTYAFLTRGSTTTLSAKASDNIGIAKVEFYLENTLLCSDTSVPYSCSWKVSAPSSGRYSLKAKAYDLSGTTITKSVTVIIF